MEYEFFAGSMLRENSSPIYSFKFWDKINLKIIIAPYEILFSLQAVTMYDA